MARTSFPSPGAYISGGTSGGTTSQQVPGTGDRSKDARVRWLEALIGALKDERSNVTQEMKRNMALYNDNHWQTFASNKRAPWKLSGVINYCAWGADRIAAMMADNKPKVTYTTPRREDDWQTEIMDAAWNEWYEDEQVQRKIEAACKLAVIRKVAYLKIGYDPLRRRGKGGISLQVVDGISVYTNREATSVDDAEKFVHEYTLPLGEALENWKKLRRYPLKSLLSTYDLETDDEDNDGKSTSETKLQPAQSYTNPAGYTKHTAPYAAPESGVDSEKLGKRVLIREVWTRPRGPNYEIDLEGLDFTVAGQVMSQPKMIEFDDGHLEPLQTVITEGNIVYQLPMSTVFMLQHAGDALGGVTIIDAKDAMEPVLRKTTAPMYPTGRRMIVAGRVVADDGANPFPAYGGIPFIKFTTDIGTSYYPRCPIDRVANQQDKLNRLDSMIFDAAHNTSNPIWRLPLNSDLSDEEVTNAPGAILREDPISLKLGKREPGPDMPGYVMQYLQFTITQIREILGLADMTAGKAKGPQAAETVSMYQDQASLAFRPMIRLVEQGVVELGVAFRGFVAQFYTEPRFMHLKNDAGVEQHITYIGTRLTADMRMQAKAGSMLPQSPQARLNIVTQLLNTPAMDVPELLRNLEELGVIESAAVLLRRLTKERGDPRLQWLIPSLQPPGGNQKKKAKTASGKSARPTTPNKQTQAQSK